MVKGERPAAPLIRSGRGWRVERRGTLRWVSCALLAEVPGIGHAFSTRSDGGTPFDLGPAEGFDAAAAQRRRRLLAAAEIAGPLVAPHQVHGATILDLSAAPGERADGVAVRRGDDPRWAAAVRTADCLPVLLAAVDGSAVAAVHAGWRGTAAGIAAAAVRRLEAWGIPPRRLAAALGPAIGPCCYQVGAEVVEAVEAATGHPHRRFAAVEPGVSDRFRLDLTRANTLQLVRAGMDPRRIAEAPWCTYCSPDLFFSYRREGAAAGRSMACIGWMAGAA